MAESELLNFIDVNNVVPILLAQEHQCLNISFETVANDAVCADFNTTFLQTFNNISINISTTVTTWDWELNAEDNVDTSEAAPGYFNPRLSATGSFCGSNLHLPCPPGYYCAGGTECPRACPKGSTCTNERTPGVDTANYTLCPAGSFCPIPSYGTFHCPSGSLCPRGVWQPSACPAGSYCEFPNTSQVCPSGHFCPLGSTEPFPCLMLSVCNEGSEREGHWPIVLVLGGVAVVILLVVRFFVYPPVRNPQFILGFVAICALLSFVLLCIVLTGFDAAETVLPAYLLVTVLLFFLMMLWREKGALANACKKPFRRQQQDPIDDEDDDNDDVDGALALLTARGSISPANSVERFRAQDLLEAPGTDIHVLPAHGPPAKHEPLRMSTGDLVRANLSRSRTLSRVNAQHHSLAFATKELDFFVPCKGGRQQFLHRITMHIPGRAMAAIMGPSGCGKSTLMNVLSGRAHYGYHTGSISINGQHMNQGLQGLRNLVGFVPQDDVMHPELTVRENVLFNAMLRLPRTLEEPVQELVDAVLEALGLRKVQASLVGSVEKRGISGGQRKRVNIAMELVTRPACIMLDEPTSGLDSSTAHIVITELRALTTATECTAMAVIHQPRWETLLLFDQLILLAPGGHLVYAGRTAKVLRHFRRAGFTVPANSNPADVLMDLIAHAAKTSEALAEAQAASPRALPTPRGLDTTQGLERLWTTHGVPLPESDDYDAVRLKKRSTMLWPIAMVVFFVRATVQLQRRLWAMMLTYFLTLVGTVLLCLAFDQGEPGDFIIAFSITLLLLSLLSGIAALRVFGQERDVTAREAAAGMKLVPFFFGKAIAAIVEQLGMALIYAAAFSLFGSTRVSFWDLFLTVFPFVTAAYGIMYTPSFLLQPAKAQLTAIIIAFLCYLFAGGDPPFITLWRVVPLRIIVVADPMHWAFGYLVTADVRLQSLFLRQASSGPFAQRGFYFDEATVLPDTRWGSGFVDNARAVWVVAICYHFFALSVLLALHAWVLGGKQACKRGLARLYCCKKPATRRASIRPLYPRGAPPEPSMAEKKRGSETPCGDACSEGSAEGSEGGSVGHAEGPEGSCIGHTHKSEKRAGPLGSCWSGSVGEDFAGGVGYTPFPSMESLTRGPVVEPGTPPNGTIPGLPPEASWSDSDALPTPSIRGLNASWEL